MSSPGSHTLRLPQPRALRTARLPARAALFQLAALFRLAALVPLAALCLVASASAASGGGAFAAQLSQANIDALRVGGSDAIGGLSDFALGNGTLCAVVSHPRHEGQLSLRGGVLVDLGHCGASNDEWVIAHSLLNLSRALVVPVENVEIERAGAEGVARLVARGALHGLSVETRYEVDLTRPNVLRIETRVERQPDGDAERAFLFGDVVLHGRRQLAPFTLALPPGASEHSLPPLAVGSVGFRHPDVDPDDMLAMIGAIVPANLHVLVGGDALTPGISYGLRLVRATFEGADGVARAVPWFSLNGESFSLMGVVANPVWLGGASGAGLLELSQTIFMDLARGERLVIEREILVGRRADVASVTDQVWPLAPRVRGTVDPSARLHIAMPDGTPVTEVRPDADGSFAFRVPQGRYALKILAAGDRESAREIDVGVDGLDLGLVEIGAPARVVLPRGNPMRLVFLRDDTGPGPRFGDDLLGFTVGEKAYRASTQASDVSLLGLALDPTEILLAAGSYTVYATRGPEYSVERASLTIESGSVTPLTIEPPARRLSHPGFVAADLHVHAAESDDSSLPLLARIASFRAAGADVIVSTEHDHVTDYGPLIARLGLADEIESIVGVEVTSTVHGGESPHTLGHANAYPVPHLPLEYRGGAPSAEGRRLRALAGDVHALGTGALLQLNHPRSKRPGVSDLHFFTHLSVAGEPFNPMAPLSTAPNQVLLERDPATGLRDLDFDVLELMNGDSMEQFRATRADWYSLLLQGEFRAAVANSDSHVARELVAFPRTYVEMPPGQPGEEAHFDEAAFVAAVRAGRSYGTTGPLLSVALRGPAGEATGIGGLFSGQAGTLEILARAADWVQVSRVRVLRNGAVVHDGSIRAGEPLALPLEFPFDAFVTVEVSGEPGSVYRAVARGFEPFAFTNPVFVDADGDGRWTAPGLPQDPLPVLEPLLDQSSSASPAGTARASRSALRAAAVNPGCSDPLDSGTVKRAGIGCRLPTSLRATRSLNLASPSAENVSKPVSVDSMRRAPTAFT